MKVMNAQTCKIILLSLFMIAGIHAKTPSYQLLTYPFSNRSAAMGGSRAIDPSGNIDIQGNPAGMSFILEPQVQAGYVNHLVGIKGYSAAFVFPLERHRLSLESIYFDYGLFDRTDINGLTDGTFGFQDMSTALGYAFQFSPAIRLGTRIGRYQRTADQVSSSEYYYDLGAVYHKEIDSLTIGVYLASAELGESEEAFPTELRIGSSKILSHLPLRLNVEGIYAFDKQLRLALGAEVLLHHNFTIRLGINSNRFDLQTGVSESDFIAGASGGFALQVGGALIESASQSFGAAGWISQMSISYHL
ncbi:MAG: hypothetical protein K9N35_03850 [Candidatus Marinimicrobia bacterium]|nr:hypothetical protein [Candidatus Neomarinimicrobiota bacterium]